MRRRDFIPSGFKLSEAACKHITMLKRWFRDEQKFYLILFYTAVSARYLLSCSSTQASAARPPPSLGLQGGAVGTLRHGNVKVSFKSFQIPAPVFQATKPWPVTAAHLLQLVGNKMEMLHAPSTLLHPPLPWGNECDWSRCMESTLKQQVHRHEALI